MRVVLGQNKTAAQPPDLLATMPMTDCFHDPGGHLTRAEHFAIGHSIMVYGFYMHYNSYYTPF